MEVESNNAGIVRRHGYLALMYRLFFSISMGGLLFLATEGAHQLFYLFYFMFLVQLFVASIFLGWKFKLIKIFFLTVLLGTVFAFFF